jgi:hypothetical protein
MELTTAQVEELLTNHKFKSTYRGEEYEVDADWHNWDDKSYSKEPVEIPGLGKIEFAEADTGGEGHGEYISMVFKITMADCADTVRHFRKEGWYASHDGSYWDGDFAEVEPYEKLVTLYRPVK